MPYNNKSKNICISHIDETKSYRTKRGLSKKGKKIVKKAVQVGRIAISYAVGKIPPLFWWNLNVISEYLYHTEQRMLMQLENTRRFMHSF